VMAVINDASQTGTLSASNLSLSNSAQIGSATFANLGSGTNGTMLYCSNCTQTPTCAAGGSGAMAMYVNGGWSCGGSGGGSYSFRNNLTNTGGTVDYTPLDATVMNAVEDFLPGRNTNGTIGNLHWDVLTLGTTCSNYMSQGVANHPGIFFLNSGSTAGDGCSLTLSDAVDGAVYPFANLGAGGGWSGWEMHAVFQTDGSTVSKARYLVGLSDNQSAYHPANGNQIAVRFDSAGGGCASNESTTNWVYEVIVAGAKTCVNSGVAAATNTWYHVRIFSTTPGTIQFQINGANSGSVAAAPTATLAPQLINMTTGGNAEGLYVDWWAMKMQGLTR
jgi:hypothetical protein